MVLANIPNLTYNLRRRVRNLEEARLDIWKMAFMDVYDSSLERATTILRNEALRAISQSREYKYPQFIIPLTRAAGNPDSIDFLPSPDFQRITVEIRLDRTAGKIEDYEQAVVAVRGIIGADPEADEKARDYWGEIYDAAHTTTGRFRKSPTKSGGRRESKLIGLYNKTIALRLAQLSQESPAPFWYLIDRGNVGTMAGTAGLQYPTVTPTNFTDTARQRIETLFNDQYTAKLRELNQRFIEEGANVTEIISAVSDTVAGVPTDKRRLTPGKIFAEIEEAGRRYYVYATKTRQIGLALRVRIR